MLLAIDVGNTQTVLGVYEGEKLLHMWRLATNVDYTSDELRIKLHALLRAEDLDGVKEKNLSLYVADLFESYYEIVDKFNRDCRLDKTEDIIWS